MYVFSAVYVTVSEQFVTDNVMWAEWKLYFVCVVSIMLYLSFSFV